MPLSDIEEAKSVWEDTKAMIAIGDYEHFTKMTDHPIAHVRPKGTDATDLMETPQGTMEKKKSFWLRNTYIQDVVSKREPYKPIKA